MKTLEDDCIKRNQKSTTIRNIFLILLFVFNCLIVHSQTVMEEIIMQTKNTALVYRVNTKKQLSQLYFGSSLLFRDDYKKMVTPAGDVFTTGGLNYVRDPAIQVTHADGNPSLQLQYVKHTLEKTDDNVSTTHIILKDPVYPFELTLHIKTYAKEDVMEQWTTIVHKEKKAVLLNQYSSAALQLKGDKYWLSHFFGDWANEMRMEEVQLPEGIKTIESKLGARATNFDLPSFMLSINKPAEEETGEVLAGTLAWSGNYRLLFENIRYSEDVDHLLQINSGINPYASTYTLQPNETFTTPAFIYTYTAKGKGQASRNLHSWALNYGIWKGKQQRQTLLNNWEATYFNFDQNKLVNLFDDAKKLGVDLFLLDDGWFGNKYTRNNDDAGLGDWDVNKTKLPDGIGYLVKEAEKKGVKFGIWVEPEMVNPKSELYEKHPDWVLKLPNRDENLRRTQVVLDLSNPEVQQHVFDVVNNLMKQNPNIAYIKWDCNRYMTNVYSPYLKSKQANLYVDYANGLYNVLKRIRANYPDLEMMWCSGGGGRAEYGGLKYMQEFWPSDNTDGLSRIFIQWGYSYFFPAAAVCAHFTSWGNQSIKFRTDVAMMGKLGFDIQLSHLKDDELNYCKQAVQNYKNLQAVIGYGEVYRLVAPYDNLAASLMYVDETKRKSVLFAFSLHPKHGDIFPKLQLKGLDPAKKYVVKEINLMDETKPQFKQNGQTFSGDYLMKVGLDWYMQQSLKSSVLEINETE